MDQEEHVDARVRAGVDRLVELGVPDDRLEPVRLWLAERWAARVRSVLDTGGSPTVG